MRTQIRKDGTSDHPWVAYMYSGISDQPIEGADFRSHEEALTYGIESIKYYATKGL